MAKRHRTSLRLFLALDLPAGARADIATWRDPLLGDLRPVAAGSLHVTLVFLGSREEDDVRRIAALAEQAAAGERPASLAPAGVRGVDALHATRKPLAEARLAVGQAPAPTKVSERRSRMTLKIAGRF